VTRGGGSGSPVTVADVLGLVLGATWGESDTIVFRSDKGLMTVAAAGGEPRLLLRADSSRGESYLFPHYLPDAKALLLQIRSQGADRLGALAELVMVDRAGGARVLPGEPQGYAAPRLSPDGRRIAVEVDEPDLVNADVWLYDIARHSRTRLTFDQAARRPIWTPDGRHIIYSRGQIGDADLYWIPADGTAPAESLLVAPADQWAGDVPPDGRTLLLRSGCGGPLRSIAAAVLRGGARTPESFLADQFDNHSPSLSPDGHWVAYASNESGRLEVYVRPFPGPGGRWQVSLEG